MKQGQIIVGRLGRPKGLRGELHVHAYRPESDCWYDGAFVHLLGVDVTATDTVLVSDAHVEQLTVSGLRRGAKGRHSVFFNEITGRTEAERVVGRYVAIPVDTLAPAQDDEFYFHEVAGWQVVDTDGTAVGKVVRALQTHIDMIEVRPVGGGDTFYIPMVDDFVVTIERIGTRIIVQDIEGLMV